MCVDTLWGGGGRYPITSANNQNAHTMPQLLFAGFPEGAIRIGLTLSILKKENRVTYFLGADNYFSHLETDQCGQRFAIATLIR